MEQKIIDAYMEYVLTHDAQPASIYAFVKEIGVEEGEFYKHFNSFEAIEKNILATLFTSITAKLELDEVYAGYSAREKILAFFYSWTEKALNYRSYFRHLHNRKRIHPPVPHYLEGAKDEFYNFCKEILEHAKRHDEIADRKFISDKYIHGLWLQFAFIHQFWLKDESKDFEKTDAAIEKSVQLAFELMNKGALDAMLDFGKFLFQNRKMAM